MISDFTKIAFINPILFADSISRLIWDTLLVQKVKNVIFGILAYFH